MKHALVAMVLLASCAHGPHVIDGSDVGVREAVSRSVARWPEVRDVAERLDVFVVTQEQIESPSRCGRAAARHRMTSCLMWLGSAVAPARMYVVEGEPVGPHVEHGLQHVHLRLLDKTNDCASHSPACGWIDLGAAP